MPKDAIIQLRVGWTHLARSTERDLEGHLAYPTGGALGDETSRAGFTPVFGVGYLLLLHVLQEGKWGWEDGRQAGKENSPDIQYFRVRQPGRRWAFLQGSQRPAMGVSM